MIVESDSIASVFDALVTQRQLIEACGLIPNKLKLIINAEYIKVCKQLSVSLAL